MKLFTLIFLALFIPCFAQQIKVPLKIPVPTDSIPEPPAAKKKKPLPQYKESVEEKLKNYFYGREVVPSIIVNNTERDQTEIQLENNKIEWTRGDKEIKIKINDDIFSLKDKKQLTV